MVLGTEKALAILFSSVNARYIASGGKGGLCTGSCFMGVSALRIFGKTVGHYPIASDLMEFFETVARKS
jgi:hypothetical protein